MTKTTTKLAVDTIVDASAPAAAQKPYAVNVFGPTTVALQKAAVLIRQGYTPCLDTPVEIFHAAGTISMTLVIGSPEQAFVEAAAVDTADAAAREQARYDHLVEQAAARQIEQAAQAEKAAKRAKLITEQRAALAALEATE